jgi:hypothetical protein
VAFGDPETPFSVAIGSPVTVPFVVGETAPLGPDPTVVLPGAISGLEATGASPRAVCRKSREFCDTDKTQGFFEVSVSRNSDA